MQVKLPQRAAQTRLNRLRWQFAGGSDGPSTALTPTALGREMPAVDRDAPFQGAAERRQLSVEPQDPPVSTPSHSHDNAP